MATSLQPVPQDGVLRSFRIPFSYRSLLLRLLCIAALVLPLRMPTSVLGISGTVDVCDEAHLDAALRAGGTIVFTCDGTITLSSQKIISAHTSLDATGHSVTLSGNNRWRIFSLNAGVRLTLRHMTITRAYAENTDGSAILSQDGYLTLIDTRFENNVVVDGYGGIVHVRGGSVEVRDSVFSKNTAQSAGAAALYTTGVLTVSNTLFAQNVAADHGGAIFFAGSTATISTSVFLRNTSGGNGSALYSSRGNVAISNSVFRQNVAERSGATVVNRAHMTIVDSTFSANRSPQPSMVIAAHSSSWGPRFTTIVQGSTFVGNSGGITTSYADTTIANSTFLNNSGSGEYGAVFDAASGSNALIVNTTMTGNSGLYGSIRQVYYHSNVTIRVRNSILAHNPSGPVCVGEIDEGSHNLQWPGTSCGSFATSADPQLATIFNYGGPTRTIGLLPGSPALDAGSPAICAAAPVLGLDQRGVQRPQGVACDVGAFEGSVPYAVAYPTALVSFPASSMTAGMTTTLRLTIENSNASEPFTKLGFSLLLDSQLQLASVDPQVDTCAATLEATAGTSTVQVSEITLGAAASCVLELPVTGVVAGRWRATLANIRTDEMDVLPSAPDASLLVRGAITDSLKVYGFPSPSGRGTPGRVTVSALDRYGNVAPDYRGTVTFSSTDANANLPADYTFSVADSGIHTFTVTLNTLGVHTLTATDILSSSLVGAQAGIKLPLFTDTGLTFPETRSVSWADYDADGDLDVAFLEMYVGSPRIYRNDTSSVSMIPLPLSQTNMPKPERILGWFDYDNDKDLDLLVQIYYSGPLRIYRNDDNDTFTEINTSMQGSEFFVTVDDYDNDGDQDIFSWQAMDTNGNFTGIFYLNQGGTFTTHPSTITGGTRAQGAWGDADNDGDPDLYVVSNSSTYTPQTSFYRNDGALTFNRVDVGLPQITVGGGAWGDYDNDGDLDILITGMDHSGDTRKYKTRLYQNVAGQFTDTGAVFPANIGVSADTTWTDYDNDGDLDIYALTWSSDERTLYRNDQGVFTPVATGTLLYSSLMDWGDYDNDGDLDILYLYGVSDDDVAIYRNNGVKANTPPSPPLTLTSTISGTTVLLSWSVAADAETPSPGLTYNLRVGTTPGGAEIMSALATPAGQRQVVGMGNVQQGLMAALPLERNQPYYWSVQSIDSSFAGSSFAPEQSFMIPGPIFLPLLADD